MIKKEFKDKLRRPFEKPETESQKKLHEQIQKLCKQDFVVDMTYPELFDVFDRVKLSYQIDMLRRDGVININKEELNRRNTN